MFEADTALGEALEREGGEWGIERIRDTGELAGSPEALEHSERCERNEPVLRTHDRYGNRIGSPATAAASSARCPRAPTPARSSTARWPHE